MAPVFQSKLQKPGAIKIDGCEISEEVGMEAADNSASLAFLATFPPRTLLLAPILSVDKSKIAA